MRADSEQSARLDPQNPWPGLLSFREQDQEFFGGRDAAAEALCRRVIAEPLTLVFGPSGLGKTSLLRAGLFPRLRQQHFFPVYIRLEYVSGRTPLQQIKDEIVKQAADSGVEATPPREDESLPEYLDRDGVDFWDERNFPCRPVLVFDQFEELFTKGREAAGALADELSPLTESGRAAARYRVVFSMREEYVAQLHGISDRFRSVFGNRFPVRRMSGGEALASVMKAGAQVIDTAVARRVIRFVGGVRDDPATEPGPDEQLAVENLHIEPALLSVICSELNVTRKEAKAGKITVSMLAGRKQAILAGFYERSFAGVSDAMRRLVEDQLVMSDGRTRDSMAVQKALETEGVTEGDLQLLVDRRVVRVQEIGELKRVELTHDLLAPEAAASRAARRARERHEAEQKAQAERLREALKAQEEAERARDEARRSLRRSRLLAASFAALLIAVGVSFLYIRFLRSETRRREMRDAIRSANRAFTDGRQSEGLAYLAHALKRDPKNGIVRSMIYDRLLYQPWWVTVSSLPLPRKDVAVTDVSADGSRLLELSEEELRIWDVASGKELTTIRAEHPAAAFLTTRFVGVRDGTGYLLWDTEAAGDVRHRVLAGGAVRSDAAEVAEPFGSAIRFTDLKTRRSTVTPVPGNVTGIQYSSDRTRLLLRIDGAYQVWDRPSGRILGKPYPLETLRYAVFSRDGRAVVTQDRRGGLRVWDAVTGAPRGEPIPAVRSTVSPDGSRVIVLVGSEARLYADTGRQMTTLRHDEQLTHAAFSEDGTRILTVSDDGAVRCWTAEGRPLGAPMLHPRSSVRAKFISDGDVVTISDRIRRWSIRDPVPGQSLQEVTVPYADQARFSQELAVFENGDGDGEHLVVSLESGALLWKRPAEGTSPLAVSPGSRFVAFVQDLEQGGLRIVVHDARVGAILWQQDHPRAEVIEAAFSGDDVLVVRTEDFEAKTSQIRFVSTRNWREAGMPLVDAADEMFVAPAGGVLAVLEEERLRVWDWRARKLAEIPSVATAKFSPDGKRLAVAAGEVVRLYDVGAGVRESGMLDSGDGVDIIGFTPDGRTVVTSSTEVVFWDAATAKRRGRSIARPLSAEPRFSRDGTRVALLFQYDNSVQVCDTSTGWPVVRSIATDGALAALAPDGRSFLTVRDQTLTRIPIAHDTASDSLLVAKLAETVAGGRVDDEGFAPAESAAELGSLADSCQRRSDPVCRFVGWFHDGYRKSASPLASVR